MIITITINTINGEIKTTENKVSKPIVYNEIDISRKYYKKGELGYKRKEVKKHCKKYAKMFKQESLFQIKKEFN